MMARILGSKAKWALALFTALSVVIGRRFWIEGRRILALEITAWTQDHSADCAVVPTGKAGRVREGFDLLNQNQIQKLIISGVYPKATLEDIFKEWPYYGSVSEKDVILEKRSGSTSYSMSRTTTISPGWKSITARPWSSIAKARRQPEKVFSASFPDRWPARRFSSVAKAREPLSARPPMVPDG